MEVSPPQSTVDFAHLRMQAFIPIPYRCGLITKGSTPEWVRCDLAMLVHGGSLRDLYRHSDEQPSNAFRSHRFTLANVETSRVSASDVQLIAEDR